MKYVALLSGGKDSCFNLLHCHYHGHELIAAASLHPPAGLEEIDSFMYQTVGQDAVQLVADALQVPLHRGVIKGVAIEQSLEYGARSYDQQNFVDGDETEDLFELLCRVKTSHPEIQAVSVGAILSNYQRLRVEQVCGRLLLTPLCYLWQRNQDSLLFEMIAAHVDAVVIKVASMGLNRSHLGQNLVQMRPHLQLLHDRFGSHICGEGGEYETLTLDCPLFQSRIKLLETEVVTHSDSAFASVYYLRVKRAELEVKEVPHANLKLTVPSLLDPFALSIYNNINKSPPIEFKPGSFTQRLAMESRSEPVVVKCTGPWVCISNIYRPFKEGDESIEDEVKAIFNDAKARLAECDLELRDIVHINLFLASMNTFAAVNSAYSQFFARSPPSRVCVSCNLPETQRIRMELIGYRSPSPDVYDSPKSLHVQSFSYWAPANIGPYSQAVAARDVIFVSGQIGLMPSSGSLPVPRSFATEVSLSLQHVERIRTTLGEDPSNAAPVVQGCIIWLTTTAILGTLLPLWQDTCVGIELEHLRQAPTLFLITTMLPRNALIETQATLCKVRHALQTSLHEGKGRPAGVTVNNGIVSCKYHGNTISWERNFGPETGCAFTVLAFDLNDESGCNCISNDHSLTDLLRDALSIRLFFITDAHAGVKVLQRISKNECMPITSVGVTAIATRNGLQCRYAACIMHME